MDELKKPYKITLWEDKPQYTYDQQDNVKNQWLEEVCIATIGSNTMDTPIRAFNPILTEDLNGSKTFTFTTYYRYWDDEAEDFKINPFTNLLVNERKVKLKYDDQWYDFVIKQVQENSETNTFTYTCKDLFVNELGKTGYDVELNVELQNNMGTVTELGKAILDGSTWTVDEVNSDTLRQYNKESLYIIQIASSQTTTDMLDDNTTITIPADTPLYVFYSCVINKEAPGQILWVDGEPKIDDQGFITNGINCKISISNEAYEAAVPATYFGSKLIQKQQSKFYPQIEETCYLWEKDGSQYYAYTETEYTSSAEIQQLLSNNSDFMTTNGWSRDVDSGSTVMLGTIEFGNTFHQSIHFAAGPGNTSYVHNSGFYDNRAQFSPGGTVQGEPFILAVKTNNNSLISGATVVALHKDDASNNKSLFTFSTTILPDTDTGLLKLDEDGYKIFRAACANSIAYQSLVNEYGNIDFKLAFTADVDLIDIKVFKQRYDSEGNTIIPDMDNISYTQINNPTGNPQTQGWYEDGANGVKVPTTDTSVVEGKVYYSGATNSIIRVYYNMFPSNTNFDEVYGKEDLEIIARVEGPDGYTPVLSTNYEKVTSITGAKSNRFNLIQNCCEAFECWAKFVIEHDSKGRAVYEYVPLAEQEFELGGRYYQRTDGQSGASSDDSKFQIYTGETYVSGLYKKVYHKYVVFKEFIGQDNPVGFRYGINLKSITRQLVSDQIATKVIVQAAANDLAPNGVCTIQQANLNPTGENALYNFQYFINHELIDKDSLYDDLYGTNGGIGLFTRLHQLNSQSRPIIEELAKIGADLNTLESRDTVYTTLLTEAENKRQDIINELSAAGYSDDTIMSGGEYITKLRNQRDSYTSTITHYTQLKQEIANLLYSTRNTYQAKVRLLNKIMEQKTAINNEFHSKYSQFIQEGTWTSNDYYDPNLYFDAANMVSFTSAFPQVSYTINVIEISEIEGFEPYKFKIGDKTYVEDIEFFGYDDKHRPYKEEIVVSQVKINLDDPSQNTLTVRNYKTQFQDLFQRIAATSQSLQYHEGEYNRAAAAVTSEGTIDTDIMQNSLINNMLIIQNAKNQNVVWDDTGITISNSKNPNEIVKLTSGGIVLTGDGGQSWTTGITGSGINANIITAGRIDTSRIRIFNEGQQTFEWNGKGIHAFAMDDGQVQYGQFVRFDKYGLYGYAGGDPDWDPDVQVQSETTGISKVIRDSIFSLTWEGLNINIPPNSQTVDVINVNNGTFKVDKNGNLTCNNASINNGSFSGNIYASGTITSGTDIYSPNIYAQKFSVLPLNPLPRGVGESSGFSIYANIPSINQCVEFFNIHLEDVSGGTMTRFHNPAIGPLSIEYSTISLQASTLYLDDISLVLFSSNGIVNFNNATVTNLNVPASSVTGLTISDVSGLRSELDQLWAAIGS